MDAKNIASILVVKKVKICHGTAQKIAKIIPYVKGLCFEY